MIGAYVFSPDVPAHVVINNTGVVPSNWWAGGYLTHHDKPMAVGLTLPLLLLSVLSSLPPPLLPSLLLLLPPPPPPLRPTPNSTISIDALWITGYDTIDSEHSEWVEIVGDWSQSVSIGEFGWPKKKGCKLHLAHTLSLIILQTATLARAMSL